LQRKLKQIERYAAAMLATHDSKRLRLAGKLGLSILLIVVLVRNTNPAGIVASLRDQDGVWVVAATAVTLLQVLLAALRWYEVLRGLGAPLSPGTVLRVTVMGSFFNAWMFGIAGGDIMRALLAPAEAVGRATMVHSVLFDRVAALAGLGIVILPLSLFNLSPLAHSVALLLSLTVALLPLLALFCCGPVSRLLARWQLPLAAQVAGIGEAWWRFCRAWPRALATLAASAACVVAFALTAWCMANALHAPVPFTLLLVLLPPVVLMSSLPISVGGWGVREASMVVALAEIGMPAETALLMSVQMGALAALLALPGGLLWLLHQNRPQRSLPLAAS
jgi:uncharacterized membrane protein YbhN (UPF0104 family)